MDRNKICEAMYALPGGVVVKRRKSQLRAAVLFIAGVALVVVNNMYGAELTNNMRSAIVFIGGLLILSGMVMAAIQLFGSGGRALPQGQALLPRFRGALLRPGASVPMWCSRLRTAP